MLRHLIITLITTLILVIPFHAYSAPPKKAKQSTTSTQRAKDTVAKADKPLEPTKPHKATHGHGHAEHGYQTTNAQQEKRISTGQKPSGTMADVPKTTSKFSTPELEAEALGKGQKALDAKLKSGSIPKLKPNGEPNRVEINVSTNNPTGFGTSWKRKLDSSGKPIKDTHGNYIPEKSTDILKNAKIIYEYVPSTGKWNPVTYYPTK